MRREVSFDELTFDTCSRGIPRAYAFDYGGHKDRVEKEQAAWQEEQVWARRRDAFETFYVAMLRGEFTDYKERDRRWNGLRRSFAQVGIQLPDYPKDDTDLERLLVVGYSAKHGQGKPIGIGFGTLAELGHHVHKVWPKALWFYRCMLRAHGQLKTVVEQDRTKKLQGKMKDVLASLAKGEPAFEPQRAWDPLLVRLFPEVAQVWSADASQVASAALQASTKHRSVDETVA